jgi:hypothetical protein
MLVLLAATVALLKMWAWPPRVLLTTASLPLLSFGLSMPEINDGGRKTANSGARQ